MNETNPLETRLRSWIPRRPSRRLKERLFPTPLTADARPVFPLSWLAPLTVCLLLAFVTFSEKGDGLARVAGTSVQGPIMAMSFSNLSLASYLPGSFPNEQNGLPSDTFNWTNPVRSHSSIPSFRLAATNVIPR